MMAFPNLLYKHLVEKVNEKLSMRPAFIRYKDDVNEFILILDQDDLELAASLHSSWGKRLELWIE